MFALQKSKTRASSRQQVALQGVENGILLLPRHEYRAVLSLSSLNFELKSEQEQDSIIDTYEGFLNSLGFPLQILIRTREVDLDKYISGIRSRLADEKEAIYRQQMQGYSEFISSLVTTNKILTRYFYIIVPYSADAKTDFELVREQINLRVDIATKGLLRLGVQATQLSSLEVLDLFYSFYSPVQSKIQPLTEQALSLIHTSLIQKETTDE